MKAKLNIAKMLTALVVLFLLFVSVVIFITGRIVVNEAWLDTSMNAVDWKQYSKEFRTIASSEIEYHKVDVLFSRLSLRRYSKKMRLKQFESHLLGIMTYLYCRAFMSSDQAIEKILSSSNVGKNIVGFKQAAIYYLGKDVQSLNLSESALLFAIWGAPGRFNPAISLEHAYRVKKMILSRLPIKNGLSDKIIYEAINQPILLQSTKH